MNSHRSTDRRIRTVSTNDEYKESTPLLPVRRASDGNLPIPGRPMRSYSAEYHPDNEIMDELHSGFESDTMITTSQRRNPRFAGPRSLEMPSLLNRGLPSVDEFGDPNPRILQGNKVNPAHGFNAAAAANKAIRSSRVRKKIAARSKGGEFQARRRKRRLYFCCIAGEIDVEKMADRFQSSFLGLKGRMYNEVLHLYTADTDSLIIPKDEVAWILNNPPVHHQASSYEQETNVRPYMMDQLGVHTIIEATDQEGFSASSYEERKSHRRDLFFNEKHPQRQDHKRGNIHEDLLDEDPHSTNNPLHDGSYDEDRFHTINQTNSSGNIPINSNNINHNSSHYTLGPERDENEIDEETLLSSAVFWNYGGKEIFVFDFGAMVFWGYQDNEVQQLLETAKEYVVKGQLSEMEFEAGEDDMAFVTSYEAETITIANDVIVLPDRTSVKSRLAVSFAIAQSSVLSIFEARIEQKIEDYKYIPDTLAKCGKVALTPKELGNMIGEVFVIRHDVNLHSEILDIPDFFWKENSIEPLYRMTASYLEMEPRTEVLNKRLDLLRELLRLLQHQHETSHGVTLEWIVIWLIVVSVILELMLWVGEMIGVNLG